MTLSADTLKTKLAAALATFPATEADAIEAWAEAYRLYFADAVAGGVPVLSDTLVVAKAAIDRKSVV
jgi:hypothetical protein